MRTLWNLRAVALCLALASRLLAQTPDTATLHGHVTDQTHAPIAGADIRVTNSLTGIARTARTDAAGDFTLAGLPVAPNFKITCDKPGFAPTTSRDISLGGGATADVNLEMSVAGGKTQVTGTGVAGEVRTDAPQLGDRIIGQQLAETPMLNRRITYLPLLNSANRPAINQGDVFMNQFMFTTNGAGRRQPWFEVDGSTGNDAWGRQTIFTNIPLAAVQEMTILENSFTAEYGGSTGAAGPDPESRRAL